MDGFISFFKEPGITSNRALSEIKKIIGQKKTGYLGTLDPVAEGILPVGLGKGTKLFPYFETVPKRYRATIIFGTETDTQDATGKTTKTGSADRVTKAKLENALLQFTGEISQVPPMYSAKKINGERLYKIARKGEVVEREGKKVTVHSINLETFDGASAVFTAVVSQGTYIRTLCEDIGRSIGVPAHMGGLVREEVHLFNIANSVTLKRLEELKETPEKYLLPMDFPITHMPRLDVTVIEHGDLSNGLPIYFGGDEGFKTRLYAPDGKFIGIGRTDPYMQKVLPEKILFPISAGAAKRPAPLG